MSRARSSEGERESRSVCPSCRAVLSGAGPHRPFCSARCKLVDLGRWFNEEYGVPGEDAIAFDGLDGLPEDDATARANGGWANADDE